MTSDGITDLVLDETFWESGIVNNHFLLIWNSSIPTVDKFFLLFFSFSFV